MNLLSDTFNKLLEQASQFLPRLIGAIVMVILGLIIARIIARVVKKILEKIKIDSFGQKLNDIDFINKANIDIKISAIVAKFFYYIILLFFLIFAADILQMESISQLVVDMFNFLPKLLVAFVFLIFGTLLAELIRSVIEATLGSLGIPSSKIIGTFLFYFLFINVVILAIEQAEINTTFLQQNISIIIAGGVLAFAIGYGLASRDVVSNFLSSLYTKDKVSVGDIIEIGDQRGQVTMLDKTSITIATPDKRVIFPLKHLLNEKVAIYSSDKKLEEG